MAHFHHSNIGFNIQPPPAAGTRVSVQTSAMPLVQSGFNMPVEITTATAFTKGNSPQPLATISFLAHFDTGASRTMIDENVAKHLNLVATGQGNIQTAAGSANSYNYAIDIAFLNNQLKGIQNLQIGSCDLNFSISDHQKNAMDPKNFGMLIGRDIMSQWHITWYGPTSSVYISD